MEQEPPMSTQERADLIREFVSYMDEPSAARYFASLVPDYSLDVDGEDFELYYRMVETMYYIAGWERSGGRDAELLAEARKAAETAQRFGVRLDKLQGYLD